MEKTKELTQVSLDSMSIYSSVYQMLEDDESRDTFLNRLNYLISGDHQYIKNIIGKYYPTFNFPTPADLRKFLPKDRKVVLYGAGRAGRFSLQYWKDDDRFIGFCSGTKADQQNGCLGYPVMSPEELLSRKDLNVVISTTIYYDEIMKLLLDGGYPESQIFYMADFFYRGVSEQYFSPKFITYDNEEIFVDAGCLDLNTSLSLKNHCNRLKKIYAFEPDPENYQNCLKCKDKKGLEEAVILPFATWGSQTTLHFDARGNGGSLVCNSGTIEIPAMPIDEIVDPDDRITFIKMDVEGAELESLRGAKKTICKFKPKLAICLYHKPEDIVTIPQYVKELVPEYKLYMRHHSTGPSDTVLYAVMP